MIDQLPYLAALGVDAIWVSPWYPSPMADGGYDISDYRDIHPDFGTLAQADRFVATAHELGLRILIDLVPNHSSDQHPWFVEALAEPDAPVRDYYVWADPKPDGSPPNNWHSGPPAAAQSSGRAIRCTRLDTYALLLSLEAVNSGQLGEPT